MFTKMTQFKRPLLAAMALVGLGIGVAAAVDCGNPCRPVRTVRVSSPCNPCSSATTTTYAAPTVIAPSAAVVTYSSAGTVPSAVVTNTDYTYSSDSIPMGDMTYLVPTSAGVVEAASPIPPIERNSDVDRYYETHRVVNGQVITVPASYSGNR